MKYSNSGVRRLIHGICVFLGPKPTDAGKSERFANEAGRKAKRQSQPYLKRSLCLLHHGQQRGRKNIHPPEHVQTSTPRPKANWKQLQCGPELNLTPSLHRVWSLLLSGGQHGTNHIHIPADPPWTWKTSGVCLPSSLLSRVDTCVRRHCLCETGELSPSQTKRN